MAIIRSISGLRATTDELTKDLIQSYAHAFGIYLSSGSIIVGRDGRPSGAWMEEIIIETLLDLGHDVISLGIAPTPTVQLETEHSNAIGGISITASHNPAEWNGMKFLNKDGVFLNASENKDFWLILDSHTLLKPSQNRGSLHKLQQVEQRHIQHVMGALAYHGIKNPLHSVKAVIDAVNASGSRFAPAMLEALNCEAIPLYCDESGVFPHTPEPLSENLSDLMQEVRKHHADLGIAIDPDADRLVLIDEYGQPIGEEKTIALCIKSLIECSSPSAQQAGIALNLSTSLMSEIIAQNAGWKTQRTSVGEINVVESMKEHNCIIGGEGSGGVILPSCHFGRDSLVGIALVIALMKNTGKPLSVLASELPATVMIKGKMPWSGSAVQIFQDIERHFQTSSVNIRHDDGLWIGLEQGWIHVRTSNTEPILRYIVEHISEAEAEKHARALQILIQSNCAQ
ncbi:MAG: phosphoglucosamine mutase [Candidatus Kapaibacteriota bacterium]